MVYSFPIGDRSLYRLEGQMRYEWKHGVEFFSNNVFRTEEPLKVGMVMVDLCTGYEYEVRLVETGTKPVLHTWPRAECTQEQLAKLRAELGYILLKTANR